MSEKADLEDLIRQTAGAPKRAHVVAIFHEGQRGGTTFVGFNVVWEDSVRHHESRQ